MKKKIVDLFKALIVPLVIIEISGAVTVPKVQAEATSGEIKETQGSVKNVDSVLSDKNDSNSTAGDTQKSVNDMTTDELFEYLMSIDSETMDSLYDEYPKLNDLIDQFSDEQKEELTEKFENPDTDSNTSNNNYDINLASDSDSSTEQTDTWISDWTYQIVSADNPSNITISNISTASDGENYFVPIKYNGTETTYVLPSKVFVKGYGELNVVLGYNSSLYYRNARVNTGTIQNLTIDSIIGNGRSCFYGDTNLKSITFSEKCNTKYLTNCDHMFQECSGLQVINFANFPTNGVTSMANMFDACTSLTDLDVSGFDTSNVTDMFGMFAYCENLSTLNVSNFVTNKVVDMGKMFQGDKKLAKIDVSRFNTISVTRIDAMFSDTAISTIDVSNFDTSKVTDMSFLFSGCTNLNSISLLNFDTSKVTTFKAMFQNCTSLTSLDLSNFNTPNLTDISYMFNSCTSLKVLDISNFTTGGVTNVEYLFNRCTSLETLSLFSFEGSSIDDDNSIWYKSSYDSKIESVLSGSIYKLVSSNLKAIKLKYGEALASATQKIFANNLNKEGYTGNWTAYTSSNHEHGSQLEGDITHNGKTYVSLNKAYASITYEEWGENSDSIWFVWESKNSYDDTIAHWLWGFSNKEGNNGPKNAYKLDETQVSAVEDTSLTLTSDMATTIPNGCYLRHVGYSDNGTWVTHDLPHTLTQTANSIGFEYDYGLTTYNITYNLNGGTLATANPSTYNVLYGAEFTNEPTKAGYTFDGWYVGNTKVTGVNNGLTSTFASASDLYTAFASRTTGDITVTAKWKANSGTIVFDPNGKSSQSAVSCKYSSYSFLSPQLFEDDEYYLYNYNTTPNGTGTTYAYGTIYTPIKTDGETITLYAQWRKKVKLAFKSVVSGNMADRYGTFDIYAFCNIYAFKGQTFTYKASNGATGSFTVGQSKIVGGDPTLTLTGNETVTVTNLSRNQMESIDYDGSNIWSLFSYIDDWTANFSGTGYSTTLNVTRENDTICFTFSASRSSSVPTAFHNDGTSTLMLLIGVVGIISWAILARRKRKAS